jgi:hypothetical protein
MDLSNLATQDVDASIKSLRRNIDLVRLYDDWAEVKRALAEEDEVGSSIIE